MNSTIPQRTTTHIKTLAGEWYAGELMPEFGCPHIELEERYSKYDNIKAYECKGCWKVFTEKDIFNKKKFPKFILSSYIE